MKQGDVAYWSLAAFTITMLLAPGNFVPALSKLHLPAVTAATAIGLCALERWRRRQPWFGRRAELQLALALGVWAAALTPLSRWPGGSLAILLDLFGKSLLIFWVVSHSIDSVTKLRRLAWVLVGCSIVLSATAINNYRSSEWLYDDAGVTRIVGYEAPLTKNPNDLALVLNLILPLVLALFLVVKRGGARLLLAGVAGLNVVAIVVTFSRSAFLVLGATGALAVHRLVRAREGVAAVVVVAMGLLGVLMLPGNFTDHLLTVMGLGADKTGSLPERWRDVWMAIELIARHPLSGVGLGMNALALNPLRGDTWRMVHNVYLQLAADMGIIALLLFVGLFWMCHRRAQQAIRRARVDGDAQLFHLASAVLTSVWVFGAAALFHPAAYNLYFYYFGGLAAGLYNLGSPTGQSS